MTKDKNTSDFRDLKGLLRQYISKWYYFAISIVIMGVLGLIFATVKKPVYQVNANIVLSTGGNSSPLMSAAMGVLGDFGGMLGANAEIEDEIFIITSHSVLKNVAKDLDLNINHQVSTGFLRKEFKYKDFPVQIYPAPGITDTLRTSITFKIKANEQGKVCVKAKARKKTIVDIKDGQFPLTLDTPYGSFVLDKTSSYPAEQSVKTTISVCGYGSAAEALAEDISVDMASKRSNVIRLGYCTPYPEYGELVLNKVIQLYNQRGIEMKNNQNGRTSAFLQERVAMAQADLNEAERSMQQFKEQNKIVEFEADAQYAYTLRGENEGRLTQSLTRAEILKSNLDFLKNPENSYSLIPALSESAGFSDALNTYNSLILQRIDLARTVTPTNPMLKKLDAQIDAMRANLIETMGKAYKNALIVVNDLQKNMAKSSSTLGKMPKQINDYVSLSRDLEVKQQIYLFLLKSLEETELTIAKADPNAEIIDEAYTLDEPLGLSKKAWLVVFVFIGCCIPPIIIYIQNLIKESKEKDQE